MRADHTRELLDRWNAGDRTALDDLLRDNLPWIRRHVRQRLGDGLRRKAETDDMVQDAVLEMLRYGPRFTIETRAHLRALLARIAENVLRGRHDWFHRQRRAISQERPLPTDTVLGLDSLAAPVTSPSVHAQRHEREAWVRLAPELLDPADRDVIVLREWQEHSFAAIATEIGTTEDAARMRFNRALARLAKTGKSLRQGDLNGALG